MSQQSKPIVYTFDEICESQDLNHEHEFVDKKAFDRVVEALNWMMRYADHTSQCNSIDSWAKKCSCGFDSGWKMQNEALEKLGAK